jgi:hypothetical protein
MNYLIKEKIKKIDNKYFKELPNKSHIDRRFGKPNLKFTKNFIINNLYFLLKKLSDICKENDIKLVIAHGTLIGHYFNKKVLPWDDDIDVVLIGESIQKFIKLNTKKLSNQYFLLDINPNCINRNINDRKNVIDARLISKQFGFFIDITFLTFNKFISGKYRKTIVNCKSPHYYDIKDILPLREDKFNGIDIYVPNNIEKVLISEYGINVLKPKYKNWIFRDNEWKRI